ncbi:hypothetical protein AKJ64_03310 [candidate division MSBL1 archaeon SCGC-AAA259E17]|uniref:Uncharacterized protein n=1 Tax=candidate division MSBL1 archaeon SCGC-AAA259E17 TaxID=1698263 RepID=A0A133UDY4_9EURY|nr:hypothetical protein AKJ64_03310 [candidate division MSBL1 archaeon SCGC-AAA259E17]
MEIYRRDICRLTYFNPDSETFEAISPFSQVRPEILCVTPPNFKFLFFSSAGQFGAFWRKLESQGGGLKKGTFISTGNGKEEF